MTRADDLKAMTVKQLRSRAKGWHRVRFDSRKEHKKLRETMLLPIIDEFRTRPEAQEYGALYAFLRDIGVKPGTVRQWRKRLISPRPSNGRKRNGNGRAARYEGSGALANGNASRHALNSLTGAIESTLELAAAGRIKLPALANGNASLEDRLAHFLGFVDKDGHASSAFRSAFKVAHGRKVTV